MVSPKRLKRWKILEYTSWIMYSFLSEKNTPKHLYFFEMYMYYEDRIFKNQKSEYLGEIYEFTC